MSRERLDLPAPVLPQMPIFSPLLGRAFKYIRYIDVKIYSRHIDSKIIIKIDKFIDS